VQRLLRQGVPWRGGLRNLSDTDAFRLSILPMQVDYFDAVKGEKAQVLWHANFEKLTWQAYGGGLVRADYVITTSGKFMLDITLGGVQLGRGSPYTFLVRPAPTSVAHSTVFGSIASCQAGIRCAIHVEVRDAYGNRRILEDDSGPNCHAHGLLADCVPVDSDPITNGQLPSCLDVSSGQPGENAKASSSCGDAAFGSFLVIFPQHAQPLPERLLLSKENLYSGGYNVTSAGVYDVSVVWDASAGGMRQVVGELYPHIRNSPFQIEIVAGQTSPAQSSASGACRHRAYAHQVCSFSLILRDVYSNPRNSGGDLVAAMLQGPENVGQRAGPGPAAQTMPVTIRGLSTLPPQTCVARLARHSSFENQHRREEHPDLYELMILFVIQTTTMGHMKFPISQPLRVVTPWRCRSTPATFRVVRCACVWRGASNFPREFSYLISIPLASSSLALAFSFALPPSHTLL